MYETEEKLKEAVRRTPLVKRLGIARKMVGNMVKEERRPKISIPPMPTDEDVLIVQTLMDAAEQLEFENLRDRFAMACLTGLMADSKCELDFADAAPMAYKCADAMMRARNA